MKEYPFAQLPKDEHTYKRFKGWVLKSVFKDDQPESFLVPYERSRSIETFMVRFNKESDRKLRGHKSSKGLEVYASD